MSNGLSFPTARKILQKGIEKFRVNTASNSQEPMNQTMQTFFSDDARDSIYSIGWPATRAKDLQLETDNKDDLSLNPGHSVTFPSIQL